MGHPNALRVPTKQARGVSTDLIAPTNRNRVLFCIAASFGYLPIPPLITGTHCQTEALLAGQICQRVDRLQPISKHGLFIEMLSVHGYLALQPGLRSSVKLSRYYQTVRI